MRIEQEMKKKNKQLKTRPPEIIWDSVVEINKGNIDNLEIRVELDIYFNPKFDDFVNSLIEILKQNKSKIISYILKDGISIQNRQKFKSKSSKSISNIISIKDKTLEELKNNLLKGNLSAFDNFKSTRGRIYVNLKPTIDFPIPFVNQLKKNKNNTKKNRGPKTWRNNYNSYQEKLNMPNFDYLTKSPTEI